jgi:hypothetical protein
MRGDALGLLQSFPHRAGSEIRRARCAMLSAEGHRDRQGTTPLIHILNDLIVRKASRSAMNVAQ